MSDEQASSAADTAQRQVRVQLTSKEEEVALPDNTGPILVPTGKKSFLMFWNINSNDIDILTLVRIQVFAGMRYLPWSTTFWGAKSPSRLNF